MANRIRTVAVAIYRVDDRILVERGGPSRRHAGDPAAGAGVNPVRIALLDPTPAQTRSMTQDVARGRWQLQAVVVGGVCLLLTPAAFAVVKSGRTPRLGDLVEALLFLGTCLLLARGHAWLRWLVAAWMGLLTIYFANVLYMAGPPVLDVERAPFLAGLVVSALLAALTWSPHLREFTAARRAELRR